MAKNWRALYETIPAERRARIESNVAQDMAEMALAEMRRARELTQNEIARNLEVNQAWVSKVERQADMYVSTLRSYVEAMGGELEIIARFHDKAVRLRQFEELEEGAAARKHSEVSPATSRNQESAMPHVNVWSPRPIPASLQEAPLRARIWDSGETSTPGITPGRHTPARRITSKVA